MAEPLHKSSDVPDFSTYPASPADQAPREAGRVTPLRVESSASRVTEMRRENWNRELPLALPEEELHARARQIGTLLGQAANMLRSVQENANLRMVKDRATESVGGVAETAAGLKDQALEQIDHLSAQVSEQYANLADQASEQYDRIRQQAQQAMGDAEAKIQRVADRAREQARAGIDKTRYAAQRARQDYPVQVILAVGVVGFIAGAMLRARRGNA